MDPRNLLREVRRHRRAVRLVIGGHLGPERRAREIERRGDVLRRVIGDELAQHRHEDVDRVRGLATRAGQTAAAHRVIRAIHLRAAVDQKYARGRRHRVGTGREKPREKRVYHSRNVVGSGTSFCLLGLPSARGRRPGGDRILGGDRRVRWPRVRKGVRVRRGRVRVARRLGRPDRQCLDRCPGLAARAGPAARSRCTARHRSHSMPRTRLRSPK